MDLSCEDILRVGKLVLILGVMLNSSTNEPDRTSRALDQETATGVDRNLGKIRICDPSSANLGRSTFQNYDDTFNVMVRCPEPIVL